MTEFEKMRSEEFYDFTSEECLASYYRAGHDCWRCSSESDQEDSHRYRGQQHRRLGDTIV